MLEWKMSDVKTLNGVSVNYLPYGTYALIGYVLKSTSSQCTAAKKVGIKKIQE